MFEEDGIFDGGGQVAEKLRHLAGGFQAATGIDLQAAAGGVERRVPAQAGENIGDGAMGGDGVVDAAGGEEGETVRGGEVDEELNFAFFSADAVALEFDVETVRAEDAAEFFEGDGCRVGTGGAPRVADGAFFVAGERDQAVGKTRELGPGGETGAFAFLRVGAGRKIGKGEMRGAGRELRFRDELAEILITGAGGDEERNDGAVFHSDLGADAGAQAVFATGSVKAGCAVNAVAVEHGGAGEAQGASGERE